MTVMHFINPRIAYVILVGFATLAPAICRAQIPCAPPPPKPPKRISGGEGFPPLPLPVTPLRRTERKRPPAPPTLMTKVNYVNSQIMRQNKKVWQWTTAPGDTHQLFRSVQKELGLNYKAEIKRFKEIEWLPATTPILYFSGREPLELYPVQRKALRQYVLDGGAIIGAAGSGYTAFADSFRKAMRSLFPDRPWHGLPFDHPIYRSHHTIEKLEYRRDEEEPFEKAPILEGLNFGGRTSIILSPVDLSCGWDNHTHPQGYRIMPEDARRLGLNMIAYLLATYRLGRVSSTPVVFREVSGAPAEIQVGQIVHGGDWDPDPSGLQYLLKKVSGETSGMVSYQRVAIDPQKDDLRQYPYLYMTGLLDFTFPEEAVQRLRQYLSRGGFLMISNGANRRWFNHAVRRELGRVLPERPFARLAPSHPVYSCHFALDRASHGNARLEGITLDGATCVIYSPGSIGSAWDGEPRPFVELPDSALALKMGVNVLVYAMTH